MDQVQTLWYLCSLDLFTGLHLEGRAAVFSAASPACMEDMSGFEVGKVIVNSFSGRNG